MSTPPSNTNVGILAAGLYPSLAALRAATPPVVQRFARILGFPGLFRFAPLDASTDDGWTVLVPNAGGGAWLLDRMDDRGVDLGAGPATLGVYGGPWRVIPASTLTGNAVYTLDTAGAVRGDTLDVTRLDVSVHTAAFVNGGPAAGTLSTFPASSKACALFWFNGTDWMQRRGSVMV